MRTKILAGLTATAIAAGGVAVTPAQAAWHGHYYGGSHYYGGWGWGAPLAGFAAGAISGGAIANSQAPYYYGPPPGYYYGPPGDPAAVAYCVRRFKSYDPVSGTFLGYDGYRHLCP
jgi:hypothetical protein